MKFKYIAIDSHNKKQEGYVQADNREKAVKMLKETELKIISLKLEKPNFFKEKVFGGLKRVSAKDFVIFSRQLSILVDANVPLLQALRTLRLQVGSEFLALKIQQVIADIEGGSSLGEAFEKHPEVFSRFYVNMVKAGEMSGSLQKSLNDLADNIEKNYDLSKNLKSAMYYPGFILSAMIIVGFSMMAFVMPKLLAILSESNVVLPLQTRLLIWLSDFCAAYWWGIIIVVVGIITILVYYIRTEDGRRDYDSFILKIPIFNNILRDIYIARFSGNLTSLLQSGLTINVALIITSDIIGNEVYREALMETVGEIKKGEKIGEVFDRYDIFPPLVIQMIQVGEITGRIDHSLSKITEFYTKEADNLVKNFSTLIEPIIMVILAIGVGILVSAVLLPIYQVATSMS